MIEHTASGIITAFGLLLILVGIVVLYLTGWAFLYTMAMDKIDNYESDYAVVLSACLILYTGIGIVAIGLIIGVCGDLNG